MSDVSTDPLSRREDPFSVEPRGGRLPVRLPVEDDRVGEAGAPGGADEVLAGVSGPGAMRSDDGPDRSDTGWVVPPGGSRVDALFEIRGTSLGISRVARAAPPVWLDLYDLVGLDAIGDPDPAGRIEVEITMADGSVIGASWSQPFCDAVVDVLAHTAQQPRRPAASIEPDGPAGAALQPSGADVSVEEVQQVAEAVVPSGPAPSDGLLAGAAPGHAASPDGSGGTLVLEDVVYLGGYPGQSRRRKRCKVTMTAEALELSGPSDLQVRIPWQDVTTVEVQNADEARFRMNTKIHRDASALVVECGEGVTVLLEARDCPTIALRSAISQLMADLPVSVV